MAKKNHRVVRQVESKTPKNNQGTKPSKVEGNTTPSTFDSTGTSSGQDKSKKSE